MKKIKIKSSLAKCIFFLLLANIFFQKLFAQQPPFYNEIQFFKLEDSIMQTPKHAILFVGSSSFRKWTDMQSYFPDYKIINRGFGGSTLKDVIYYANDIILPYQPRQIVIYCGENDFAADSTVSSQTVFESFKSLYTLIREKLNNVPVVFVSIKPSPSRRQFFKRMIITNQLIESFLSKQANAYFVDVFHLMLNTNNQPKPEIFLNDSLHMNANGYVIWQKAIQPYLLK